MAAGSPIKRFIAKPDIAAKIEKAARFKKIATLGTARAWPIISLGTNGQVRRPVQPQHTAIPVEQARITIRVDGFNPCTGPAAEFLVRDVDQRPVQVAFDLPVS